MWIFDLDNTLHDAATAIFPSMHEQIGSYLKRHFGVDDEGARAMRQVLWSRYGTTMNGLMRHHGTDPRQFLRDRVQAVDEKRGHTVINDDDEQFHAVQPVSLAVNAVAVLPAVSVK